VDELTLQHIRPPLRYASIEHCYGFLHRTSSLGDLILRVRFFNSVKPACVEKKVEK
jgi:hypothetical protein